MTLPLLAYRLATRALEPLAPRLLDARVKQGKEDRVRVDERLGVAGVPRPDGDIVWLHGVSVGETLSLLPIVERFVKGRPDLTVLVTSGTVTSAELLARRLPPGVIHQFAPVDGPHAVAAFLDHWRPSLGLFVESELWPNLILAARARAIPLALVSARITQKTARGWARFPASARELLGAFSLVLPQDRFAATALTALGATTGPYLNLKLLGEPLPYDRAAFEAFSRDVGDRPVVVAASTHHGEDEMLASAVEMAALDPRALLIVVPRHPARGPDIVRRARAAGQVAALRSSADPLTSGTTLYVADTLGELGLFLRMADVVIMGGSFQMDVGGHNPLEAARLGKSVLYGHDCGNWIEVYANLALAGGAVLCETERELTAQVQMLVNSTAENRRRSEAALRVAQGFDNGLEPLMTQLAPLLPPSSPRR